MNGRITGRRRRQRVALMKSTTDRERESDRKRLMSGNLKQK
jgi:hypothetical protein